MEVRQCKCGCGQTITTAKVEFVNLSHEKAYRRRVNKMRKPNYQPKPKPGKVRRKREMTPCACGCGYPTKRKFVDRLHEKAYWAIHKEKRQQEKPCACGCGEMLIRHEDETPTQWRRRKYIDTIHQMAHTYQRVFEQIKDEPLRYCECGCGRQLIYSGGRLSQWRTKRWYNKNKCPYAAAQNGIGRRAVYDDYAPEPSKLQDFLSPGWTKSAQEAMQKEGRYVRGV